MSVAEISTRIQFYFVEASRIGRASALLMKNKTDIALGQAEILRLWSLWNEMNIQKFLSHRPFLPCVQYFLLLLSYFVHLRGLLIISRTPNSTEQLIMQHFFGLVGLCGPPFSSGSPFESE